MTARIRVILIDDDDDVRASLREILDVEPDITIVADAADGSRARSLSERLSPDLVIVDLNMPGFDGIATTRSIMELDAPPLVLVLTSFHLDERVIEALDAGASGYLLKSLRPGELPAAVRAMQAGGHPLAAEITRNVIERATAQPAASPVGATPHDNDSVLLIDHLAPREIELAVAVGMGLSNTEIGERLGLTPASVKTYVSRMLGKLGFTNRTQLAILAYRSGLLDDTAAG